MPFMNQSAPVSLARSHTLQIRIPGQNPGTTLSRRTDLCIEILRKNCSQKRFCMLTQDSLLIFLR